MRIERRDAEAGRPELEVRASARRTKTATAWWEGTTLIVALPARVNGAEREQLIEWLVARSTRRRPAAVASDPELLARAEELSAQYRIGAVPTSITFVTNQRKRWGSCTVATGAIRLSDRLRHVPGWVLDAVLVHELAHLVHADHSSSFHELANRYPRQEEATRFLDGYQLGLDVASGDESSAGEDTMPSARPRERRAQSSDQGSFGLEA